MTHALDGWMAEVRESTPDQTPGPSRARWMEGRGSSPSTSARAIYCARHMYAHSADT